MFNILKFNVDIKPGNIVRISNEIKIGSSRLNGSIDLVKDMLNFKGKETVVISEKYRNAYKIEETDGYVWTADWFDYFAKDMVIKADGDYYLMISETEAKNFNGNDIVPITELIDMDLTEFWCKTENINKLLSLKGRHKCLYK